MPGCRSSDLPDNMAWGNNLLSLEKSSECNWNLLEDPSTLIFSSIFVVIVSLIWLHIFDLKRLKFHEFLSKRIIEKLYAESDRDKDEFIVKWKWDVTFNWSFKQSNSSKQKKWRHYSLDLSQTATWSSSINEVNRRLIISLAKEPTNCH